MTPSSTSSRSQKDIRTSTSDARWAGERGSCRYNLCRIKFPFRKHALPVPGVRARQLRAGAPRIGQSLRKEAARVTLLEFQPAQPTQWRVYLKAGKITHTTTRSAIGYRGRALPQGEVDCSSGSPPKGPAIYYPRAEPLHSDIGPIRLEASRQVLWLKLDGRRSGRGYKRAEI